MIKCGMRGVIGGALFAGLIFAGQASAMVVAGSVPDGAGISGTPLTVDKAAGPAITVAWSASCVIGDSDYAVYEGLLGDFASHTARVCTTGGATSLTLDPAGTGAYYLVVPHNTKREGSYGTDSSGGPRPQGTVACLPQQALICPAGP